MRMRRNFFFHDGGVEMTQDAHDFQVEAIATHFIARKPGRIQNQVRDFLFG